MVKTIPEFRLASALGRCIGIAEDNDFIGVIGEPNGSDFDWMEEGFFEGMNITLSVSPSSERLAQLRLLYPTLFDGAENEHRLCSGAAVNVDSLGAVTRSVLREELKLFAPELCADSGTSLQT